MRTIAHEPNVMSSWRHMRIKKTRQQHSLSQSFARSSLVHFTVMSRIIVIVTAVVLTVASLSHAEPSTEDLAEDITPPPTSTLAPGVTTELTADNLEKWVLETAREHLLKNPSTEDNSPGFPVRHEPKSANLTY